MSNPLPITYYSKKYRNDFFRGKTEEDTLALYGLTQYKSALNQNNILFKGTKEEENIYEAEGEEYEEDIEEYVDEDYDEDEDSGDDTDDEEEGEDDDGEDEDEGKVMFIWRTAGDGKVREEHAERDGQQFEVDGDEWNELGQYNCRCTGDIISADEEYKKEKMGEKEAEKSKWDRMKKEKEVEKIAEQQKEGKKVMKDAERAEEQQGKAMDHIKQETAKTNKLLKEYPEGDPRRPKAECARGVTDALQAAGVPIEKVGSAKDLGKSLTAETKDKDGNIIKPAEYKKVYSYKPGDPLDEKGNPKGLLENTKEHDVLVFDKYDAGIKDKNGNPKISDGEIHGHTAIAGKNGESYSDRTHQNYYAGPTARDNKDKIPVDVYRRRSIVERDEIVEKREQMLKNLKKLL